ncbi:MAG: hypothetical protein WCA16_17990, partial [Candidatus Sulfotelmatobacter sp.]
MQVSAWPRAATGVLLAVLLSAGYCRADGKRAPGAAGKAPPSPGLYVKVSLAAPIKISQLKPGDIVEGALARDVYSADTELFPAGSRIRLTVDALQKRRRIPNDHWPWVVNFFAPRHEQYPVFRTAELFGPDRERMLQVFLVSISRRQEIRASPDKKKREHDDGRGQGTSEVNRTALPTIVLEAFPSVDEKLYSSGT